MKQSLRYILYSMLCIVSLIIALTLLWWFTTPPVTEEFATPMPYIVFVGLTSSGAVYYADVDVPIQPKWILSSLTGIQDIAGSYGQLYTVSNGGSVPKYGAYDSATQNSMRSGSVTQISVDDANFVAGVNGTSIMYASSLTTALSSTSGTAKWISISGGLGYAVGADGKLYYSATPATGGWTVINTSTNWKQVSMDAGIVCAIKTDGSLWTADTNIGLLDTGVTTTIDELNNANMRISVTGSANWTQSARAGTSSASSPSILKQSSLPSGVGFSYISLKAGRLVGVGTDGAVYYSNSYLNPLWTTVVTQPYNVLTGGPTGSPVRFSKVILMYPRLDARRKRFLGTGTKCNPNEQLIGAFCYQTCPSGRAPLGTFCPYLAKYINAIPICAAGTQIINNACYRACPSGYTANGQTCMGATTPKATKLPSTNVRPQSYSCRADGSVAGRYIRVRPSTLITNNKLCISRLIVKDSAGTVLSAVTGGSGSGSSGIKTSATDGTCADAPIGGKACGEFASYLSGATYDRDADGGKKNRSSNLYWELDLGSIKNIKSIEFTGCNYQSSNSGGTPSSGGTSGSSGSSIVPNADQITGMRVEILYNTNLSTTSAIVSRTLGPRMNQTITLNYRIQKANQMDRCYDDCPPINGVTSMDQGDDTCVAASGGITHRAVSVPLPLPDPVCGPPLRPDGTPDTITAVPSGGTSGSAITIGNWKTDPSNSSYQLSCDILPGSKLQPMQSTFIIPSKKITSNTSITLPSVYGKFGDVNIANIASIFINAIGQALSGVTCAISGTCIAPETFTTNWTTTGGDYVNADTPYVCVVQSGANIPTCPTGYVYKSSLNACEVDRTKTKTENVVTRPKNDGLCAAGWALKAVSFGAAGDTSWCSDQRELLTISLFGYNIVKDNAVANYAKPICTQGVSIAKPQRIVSNCRCLNADNTPNRRAFIYNGKCVKCSSPRDIFYPRGYTNTITWSNQQRGTITTASTTDQGTIQTIQTTQFDTLDDAKNTCESMPDLCKGVTRYMDASGTTYYQLGTSTVKTNGILANNTCWSMSIGNPSTVTKGRYEANSDSTTTTTGQYQTGFSSDPIPRAFADDYITSKPKNPPRNVQSAQEILDIYSSTSPVNSSLSSTILAVLSDPINYLRNAFGQSSAMASFAQSVERPNTYYSLTGTERRIRADIDSSTDNYGICVGPCDPEHPLHDPIQMLKDTVATPNIYTLYGTTCHDSTVTVINQPNITAINTPASGDICPTETPEIGNPIVFEAVDIDATGTCPTGTSGSGSGVIKCRKCVAQCPYGTTDNGDGTCTTVSIARTFVTPTYNCPDRKLKKVDTVCVFPCEGTDKLVGEYCEPSPTLTSISSLGSGSTAIKCTKTPYSYSTKYQTSDQPSVNKWLCDSQEDLTAILAGYLPNSGTTFYVNQEDIVCMADDASTGMYYCQSVDEAVTQKQGTQRDDNTAVCNNLTAAYYDLSNNLDVLSSAKTNAQNASVQMINIQMTLQSVYNSICSRSGSGSGSRFGSGSGSSSVMCTNLQSQLNALTVNMNAGSGATSGILAPIQIAMASRDNLVAQMTKFQCNY